VLFILSLELNKNNKNL